MKRKKQRSQKKTKLHLDPISLLDDGFLVQLWFSIADQRYRSKFNTDDVLEVLIDLDVDFEKHLDCKPFGCCFIEEGTYGRVWECRDEQEGGVKEVLKESMFGNDEGFNPFEKVYELEVSVYRELAKSPNSEYFPKLYDHFVLMNPRKGFLVIEKLGQHVCMLHKQNQDDRFFFTTTMKIAMCVGKGLKYLHQCGAFTFPKYQYTKMHID
ncbi:unnamed protein product [Caenorhabditis brenneri]